MEGEQTDCLSKQVKLQPEAMQAASCRCRAHREHRERSGAWSPGAVPEQHTAEPRDQALAASSHSCSPTAQQFPPSSPCHSSQKDQDAQNEPGHCRDQPVLPWQEELILQLSLSHSSVSLGERAAKGSFKFNHVLLKGQNSNETMMIKSSAFLPSTLHQMHTYVPAPHWDQASGWGSSRVSAPPACSPLLQQSHFNLYRRIISN